MKLPYWISPRTWFIPKPVYEKEKAGYDLEWDRLSGKISDYDYELRRLEISGGADPREKLTLQLKHKKITSYEHDVERAKLDFTEGTERDLALLEVELAHEKITPKQHEKAVATLRQEPWIGLIDDGFDIQQGLNGFYFEFDWNEYWIGYLRLNGYGGPSEDAIVEQWFKDVCRTTIAENEPEDFDVFAAATANIARMNRNV